MHIPPDWGIFFCLIVSFLVFCFIFNRLFFGPFLKLLADRELKLADLSARTEQLLKEQKAAEEERDSQLAALRHEALAARDAERRRAEAESARLIEEAKAQAHSTLERVRAGIEKDLQAAEHELQQFSRGLAIELAGRVLGRPVDGTSQKSADD
jgi:F-type H+-transporting ATPase subunit b